MKVHLRKRKLRNSTKSPPQIPNNWTSIIVKGKEKGVS